MSCYSTSKFVMPSPLSLLQFAMVIWYILCPGPLWSHSYGSWIYNYLFNQCLSLLTLWVLILFMRGVLDTTLCDKVCQWLTAGQWFSPGTPVTSTNKTDRHDYSWNIVESGVKHHEPNLYIMSVNCLITADTYMYEILLKQTEQWYRIGRLYTPMINSTGNSRSSRQTHKFSQDFWISSCSIATISRVGVFFIRP